MSAPLITKQLKHNSFTDVQAQLLNKKFNDVDRKTDLNTSNIAQLTDGKDIASYVAYIRTLEAKISALESAVGNEKIQNIINGKTEQKNYDSDISSLKSKDSTLQTNINSVNNRVTTVNNNLTTLEDDVTEIEENIKNLVPSGSVMYFDMTTCPKGWTALSSRYSSASGAFIRNLGESGRQLGSYQGGAVPDIQLALRVDYNGGSLTDPLAKYGNDDYNRGALSPTGGADEPMFNFGNLPDIDKPGDLIKSSVYNKDVKEVRPNNIALLACRKN